MSKKLLNILLAITSVLLAFFAFEILHTQSRYDDQLSIHAPDAVLHSLKRTASLMAALTGFFSVGVIYLIYLKNKKGSVDTLPQ